MKIENGRKQHGQTLVQVAILLTVLLAFLALAVDVGWMYAGRRQMQNAADAGALAGAYELCFGSENEDLAREKAEDYAELNGADHPPVVTISGNIVNVVARHTVDLFVADVVNFGTVDVSAEAEAACGAADAVCGLWPVALAQWRWMQLYDANKCESIPFYVWDGSNANKELDCSDGPEGCDCDLNNDGYNDVVEMQSRAWVDFSDLVEPPYDDVCAEMGGQGCGTNEIKCWVLSDSGAMIRLGACIPGTLGTKAGAHKQVDLRALSDDPVVAIPIFDEMGCPGDPCSGDEGRTFGLVDFGCIRVLGWDQHAELTCSDGVKWKGKVIEAEISCGGCETYCGSTTGTPAEPWQIRAVSLIK